MELAARFWKHAQTHYRKPDGTPSDEIGNYRIALRPLVSLYGSAQAGRFGPKALKAVRQRMIGSGNSRGYINKNVQRIKSLFKWAVADELIPRNRTELEILATRCEVFTNHVPQP